MKARKEKSQVICGQSFKTVFWNFEKSSWEHNMSTKLFYLKTNSYNFKVATTKFSWKFTMFQEFFYMFKSHKKNMWVGGFFFYQNSFSFIKCSPNCFNFFVNFNIFYKKGSMRSKHSKNTNTYTFSNFNTQMSFYIVIVLNL